jgi:hypothetical protein
MRITTWHSRIGWSEQISHSSFERAKVEVRGGQRLPTPVHRHRRRPEVVSWSVQYALGARHAVGRIPLSGALGGDKRPRHCLGRGHVRGPP